jgi:hypothetical protein
MQLHIVQTRWIGTDDWTNSVYVAKTLEEALQQIVDEYNDQQREEAEDNGEDPVLVSSVEEIQEASDGEFCYLCETCEI